MRTGLELVGENEVPLMSADSRHQQNPDFATRAFNHKEILALTPHGKLSPRDKLMIMLGGQLKEDEIHRREGQSMPHRAVKMAFIARLFGASAGETNSVNTNAPKEDKPKSILERLNSSALIPILASIMLAAAAYKTGETSSWKSSSDAGKATVDFVKEQLAATKAEKAALQEKYDGLQKDTLGLMAQFNADSSASAKAYADSLKSFVAKYTPPKIVVNVPAPTPKAEGGN